MQKIDQKELEKLIHDGTIDMDTIADLEKMISRKKMLKKSSKCSFIVECFLFFML